MKSFFTVIALFVGIIGSGCCVLELEKNSVVIKRNECVNISLFFTREDGNGTQWIKLKSNYQEIASVEPKSINVTTKPSPATWVIHVCGKRAGYTTIQIDAGAKTIIKITAYLHVFVTKVYILNLASSIVGWIYFLSWSISYYPQIYSNYVRQNVIGLNFDFVALNIVGFIMYSIYNWGMLCNSSIQDEYFYKHPTGLNPVLFNDLFFSLHSLFATSIVVYQCIVYEKGEQTVSLITRCILIVYAIIITSSTILAITGLLSWLDFLMYCSFVKLTVTMIKYIPQALMNYRRKSTSGWSCGSVLLDFIGGIASMLQMVLNCYNFNDWGSISGDPTKFGLGMFSVLFDLIFMFQHFILYRSNYLEHVDQVSIPSEEGSSTPCVKQVTAGLSDIYQSTAVYKKSPVLNLPQ